MQRITQSLDGLAMVAAGQGQPERVLCLAGASARLRDGTSAEPSQIEQAELESVLAPIRHELGEAAVAAAWAEGQAMTLEEAIEYALEEGANTDAL
jgi:hypothetical protein